MSGPFAALVLFGLYLWARVTYRRRFPGKQSSAARSIFFGSACLVLAVVLSGPLELLSDRAFAWHMLQHIGLLLIAPPLLLLGAPLLYLLGALPPTASRALVRLLRMRAVQLLLSPVVAWLLFVAVLWVSHFSPLYNAAMENPWLHGAEHAVYFWSATIFWSNIVQIGFVPNPLPFAARMLYVFLTIPQGAFLGLALYQTRSVLYSHYAVSNSNAQALLDQHNGGALMWIAGGLLLFAAFMILAAVWAGSEGESRLEYTV